MADAYTSASAQSAEKQLALWRRVAIGVLIMLGIGLATYFTIRTFSADATIAGTVDFTALKPDPGDEGTVTIMVRNYGTNDAFTSTGVEAALRDNAAFSWTGAVDGSTYELMARLEIEGQAVGTSDTIVVTAPAQNVTLPIKVTWADLPEDVVLASTTKLGGTAAIQGYIPEDSELQVQTRARDATSFTTVSTVTSVQMNNTWVWEEAVPLQTYQVRALLFNSAGTQIGSSDTIVADAGEDEVALKVVSGAQAPTTPDPTTPEVSAATITGRVYINGPIAANSSVLLLQRTPGQGDFKEITRLTTVNQGGMDWTWKGAQRGVQYELQAALQVNETNTATGRSQIVTAPANGVNFTINTGVTVPTPTANPSVENCTDRPNNQWDATIQFPTVNDAQQYWLQIGANPGSSEMFNQRVSANNNQQNQRATVTVNSGQTYWAQYAFSLCDDCTSDANFSQFSNAWAFHCGDQPQPTGSFRGYRCNTDTKICESTNDANAPFAPNNAGLEQCQRACQ